MLGGQITELFDQWDPPIQTGKDVDYAVVLVAACLGAVFAVAKKLISTARRFATYVRSLEITTQIFSTFRRTSAEPLATGPPISDLSPLRI
jgi:hypothetical protein